MIKPLRFLLLPPPFSVTAVQIQITGLDNVSNELAITMLRAEQRECGFTPTEQRLREAGS